MMMHLAAASLGLGSQHTTIHIEDPFKRVLGVPDLLTFNLIMPIGYPDVPSKEGVRRAARGHGALRPLTTCPKYMTNEQALAISLFAARETVPVYRNSYTGQSQEAQEVKRKTDIRKNKRRAAADIGLGGQFMLRTIATTHACRRLGSAHHARERSGAGARQGADRQGGSRIRLPSAPPKSGSTPRSGGREDIELAVSRLPRRCADAAGAHRGRRRRARSARDRAWASAPRACRRSASPPCTARPPISR